MNRVKEQLQLLAEYLQGLNKKEFQQHLILFLAGVCTLTIVALYFVHSQNNTLINRINKIAVSPESDNL